MRDKNTKKLEGLRKYFGSIKSDEEWDDVSRELKKGWKKWYKRCLEINSKF